MSPLRSNDAPRPAQPVSPAGSQANAAVDFDAANERTNLRIVAAFQVGRKKQGQFDRVLQTEPNLINRNGWAGQTTGTNARTTAHGSNCQTGQNTRGGLGGVGQAVEQPYQTNPMGDQLQQAASQPEVFLLYEGGEVAQELRRSLTHVRVGPQVKEIPNGAFRGSDTLIDLQLNEGLQVIGERAFHGCTSLRSVTLPSTVTKLGGAVFHYCSSLIEVYLNEGLQNIGAGAFAFCSALRSVTLQSTVTELGWRAFVNCSSLSEVIFLEGQRLLNQEFFACGFRREEQGLLNQEALNEMLFDEDGEFAFDGCTELRTIKISISWAVSERMARLPHECMLSVEERIHYLSRLELLQDGEVLACFPVAVSRTPGDNTDDDSDDETVEVLDTNLETARSLYQIFQLIAFHELKESSILIELALWKSIIEKGGDRACRIAIPGPAKILLMEAMDKLSDPTKDHSKVALHNLKHDDEPFKINLLPPANFAVDPGTCPSRRVDRDPRRGSCKPSESKPSRILHHRLELRPVDELHPAGPPPAPPGQLPAVCRRVLLPLRPAAPVDVAVQPPEGRRDAPPDSRAPPFGPVQPGVGAASVPCLLAFWLGLRGRP
ncbi:hypothetical protein THAOC_32122, partial [Thalassiosira oceanica]